MQRVSQETVLGHWLSVEARKPSRTDIAVEDVDGMGPDAMLDALLRREPAAYVLWQAQPITWYHLSLSAAELDRLRVVEGPPSMGWRALAADDTIGAAAARIAHSQTATLDVRAVDVELIRGMVADLEAGETVADLVLAKRRGCERPYVVDGNHRATALAMHAARTSEYEPVGAYLGIGANLVLEPLWQRVCGLLAGLTPARGGPRW